MPLTDALQESLTETVTQDVSYANADIWFSLHSADPGMTGAHEVTTGVGTGGRQQITFSGADGTDTNTAAVAFVLSAVDVFWVGYWDAQTSGTWLGGFPLVGDGTILAAVSGVASLTCPMHGLAVNDVVRLYDMPGPAASGIPGGFSADTLYYVVASADADHLELSATMGGSAISPSSSAACGMYEDESQTSFTGTLNFPATTGITYTTAS